MHAVTTRVRIHAAAGFVSLSNGAQNDGSPLQAPLALSLAAIDPLVGNVQFASLTTHWPHAAYLRRSVH